MATQVSANFNYGGANLVGLSMSVSAEKGMGGILSLFRTFCNSLEYEVLPQEMKRALEPTLELSNYYAPKDTGELRESGYVQVRGRRGNVTAEVGYGYGGKAPYAVIVHEHPELYHKPPTQAKFLQRAMDEDYLELLGRVAAQVRRRMRIG
jgi:hypothetical protein